jgi:hypothetical protein
VASLVFSRDPQASRSLASPSMDVTPNVPHDDCAITHILGITGAGVTVRIPFYANCAYARFLLTPTFSSTIFQSAAGPVAWFDPRREAWAAASIIDPE